MTKYSISRLNCYKECPLRYKFEYIDKLKEPFKNNDSTFLGDMCHRSLEKLYRDRVNGKIDTEEELIAFFNDLWEKEYDSENILHTSEQYGPAYYRLQGVDMLTRYYRNIFFKDDMEILGLETEEFLDLPNGDLYYIRIDKLAYKDGTFYVCDYKTDRKEKEQAVADSDQQLAMYAVWVRKKFPSAKDVKLIWHMLRFDGEQATVTSSRTVEELDALEKEIVELIKEIELATEFPAGNNPHCDYCTYKPLCPKFAPPKVLTIDDGIRLVDELVQKQYDRKLLDKDIKNIQANLVKIAESGGYDVVSGTSYEVPIERFTAIDTDNSDWDQFKAKVIELGMEGDYLMPNYTKLRSKVKNGVLESELVKLLETQEEISTGRLRLKNKVETD